MIVCYVSYGSIFTVILVCFSTISHAMHAMQAKNRIIATWKRRRKLGFFVAYGILLLFFCVLLFFMLQNDEDAVQLWQWLTRKDGLRQDAFLLGPPGPERRRLALGWCELLGKDRKTASY